MSEKLPPVDRLDRNMALKKSDELPRVAVAKEDELLFSGFPWRKAGGVFRRLPEREAFRNMSGALDALAWHTAGGTLRFSSDALSVGVECVLRNEAEMDHMPQTGSGGFDLYVAGEDLKWQFAGVSRYPLGSKEFSCELFCHAERRKRNFLLHFPLYNGVESFQLSLDRNARLFTPPAFARKGKIILYGTSITQGGCASRPGMAYGNILSRMLNCEVVNLGFSGNGKGETEIAECIASLEDSVLFLLDFEANLSSFEELCQKVPAFIKCLRHKHPVAPIVLLSRPAFAGESSLVVPEFALVGERVRLICRNEQRKMVENSGDKALYFFDGGELFGADFDDCTVDGIHPNDLGFFRIAQTLFPFLSGILTS